MNLLKNHLKLYILIIAAVSVFAITSCNSAKNDSQETSQLPEKQKATEEVNQVNPEAKINLPEEIEAKEISVPVSETTEQPAAVQNNAEVMLNPPHGEPFHRCDIPVGAPLNSVPANTTRQTTNNTPGATSPAITNTAPRTTNNPTAPTIENAMRMNPSQTRSTTPVNSGTKPRLNPPHGQPWHRCDIAVGSPLP